MHYLSPLRGRPLVPTLGSEHRAPLTCYPAFCSPHLSFPTQRVSRMARSCPTPRFCDHHYPNQLHTLAPSIPHHALPLPLISSMECRGYDVTMPPSLTVRKLLLSDSIGCNSKIVFWECVFKTHPCLQSCPNPNESGNTDRFSVWLHQPLL